MEHKVDRILAGIFWGTFYTPTNFLKGYIAEVQGQRCWKKGDSNW